MKEKKTDCAYVLKVHYPGRMSPPEPYEFSLPEGATWVYSWWAPKFSHCTGGQMYVVWERVYEHGESQ